MHKSVQVGIFAFKRSATVFGRNARSNILALSSALFPMGVLQIFTADILMKYDTSSLLHACYLLMRYTVVIFPIER